MVIDTARHDLRPYRNRIEPGRGYGVTPPSRPAHHRLGGCSRNVVDLLADVVIHAVDALTDAGDSRHGAQRDEPRQQRVFDQVLTFFVATEPLKQCLHVLTSLPVGAYHLRAKPRLKFEAIKKTDTHDS